MIVRYPDPILLQPAAEVTTFGPVLETLVAGMFRIVGMANGIGLAAPQIGASLRVSVVDIPTLNEKFVMVNPKITHSTGEVQSEEACLSLPGIAAIVPRAANITVEFQDETGVYQIRHMEGALACVVAHEIDHLRGVLYIDYLGAVTRDLLLTRYRKIHAQQVRKLRRRTR